jgi:hypothetical protein
MDAHPPSQADASAAAQSIDRRIFGNPSIGPLSLMFPAVGKIEAL